MNGSVDQHTRLEAADKTSGRARYAAEHHPADLAYAALVVSPVARGEIVALDSTAARRHPGVIAVLGAGDEALRLGKLDPPFSPPPLQDRQVRYAGQIIALALAHSQESATAAAALVQATFRQQVHEVYPPLSPGQGEPVASIVGDPGTYTRGNASAALATAAVKIDQIYETVTNTHAPIEPPAAVATWIDGGARLHVYCSTQGVIRIRDALAQAFALNSDQVLVECQHVGGGFGSKVRTVVPVALLAACAARALNRPVRLELTRSQVFALSGHRQPTRQRVVVGADATGALVALVHEVTSRDAFARRYSDPHAFLSRVLYSVPHTNITHTTVPADVGEPQEMRAPGEATGAFALESALDELAAAFRMDPLELRRRNFSSRNLHSGSSWSSNGLLECYDRAAERFGWSKRAREPAATRRGRKLIGSGVATAVYPTHRLPANVRASLRPDRSVLIECGTQDIGTGTRTVIAELAAAELGIERPAVYVEVGRSDLPAAPPSVGSMTAASVAPAVIAAVRSLRAKALEHGSDWRSAALAVGVIEAVVSHEPPPNVRRWHAYSFGVVMTEVEVDIDLGEVRVRRMFGAYDCGRVLSPQLARSQAIGGMVFGIGQALSEETVYDRASGRILNADLGGYLIPVSLDVPEEIDVEFVGAPDPADSSGVKTLGMMGTVGTAAAIANAVFHATGRRIRKLPITPEQLL